MATKRSRRPWMGADGVSFFEYQQRMRQQQAQPAPVPPAPEARPRSLFEVFYGAPETPAAQAPARPAIPTRPAFEKRRQIDPGQYFDMAGLWEHIRGLRRDPAFRPPTGILQVSGPIADPLASALATSAYFQMDPSRIRMSPDPWRDYLDPFLLDLMTAMNQTKPGDVPGSVRFERAPDFSLWMVYQG